jgi:hypothetical protein
MLVSGLFRVPFVIALLAAVIAPQAEGQSIPAIPEPPVTLFEIVTDRGTNQSVTISSATWNAVRPHDRMTDPADERPDHGANRIPIVSKTHL